jgi:hypothetical protein
MNRILFTIIMFCITSFTQHVFAQKRKNFGGDDAKGHTIGISIGPSWALTDLGGAPKISSPLLRDVDFPATKFGASLFYRYNFNEWVSVRANLLYGMLHADDAHVGATAPSATTSASDSYFRRARNFDFKSHLVQLTVMGEVNLKKYDPHAYGKGEKLRWAPYVGGGLGFFWFNPYTKTFSTTNLISNINTVKAGNPRLSTLVNFTPAEINALEQYEGTKIKLRKLRTEGQDKAYSAIQFNLSALLGIKFNLTDRITLAVEGWYHQTFTDYLDDVGGNYPDLAVYNTMSPLQRAMSVRYFETANIEDGATYSYGKGSIWGREGAPINSGHERGDNNNGGDAKGSNDQFFSFQVSLAINLFNNNKNKSFGCGSRNPYNHKFSCPKW